MKFATLGLLAVLLGNFCFADPGLAQTTPPIGAGADAIETLRQRAGSGDLDAMHNLGTTLLNDRDSGNDAEGLDWLRQAAQSGNWASAYYLAQSYLYGWHSLSNKGREDLQEGIRWLRMAGQNVPPETEGGDVYTFLGRIYSGFELGRIPSDIVPIDYEEATKWYRLCAVEYSSYCQRELGNILLESPTTAVEGYKWLHRAADLANPMAMHDLGELFSAGRVVRKDLVQSLAWFECAKKWNPGVGAYFYYLRADTETKIAEISRSLAPLEIERAHQIASGFKPVKHY